MKKKWWWASCFLLWLFVCCHCGVWASCPSGQILGHHPSDPAAIGSNHVCVLFQDGRVKCWGDNLCDILGRTGPGLDPLPTLPYVDLGPGRTAKQISAGRTHTCAILDNDELKCWGCNHYGQCGTGDTTSPSLAAGGIAGIPAIPLAADPGVIPTFVHCGEYTTCVVLSDGTAKCWGRNDEGQCGQGSTAASITTLPSLLPPIDLGSGVVVRKIQVSEEAACALLHGDKLKCWGSELWIVPDDFGRQPGHMGDNLRFIEFGSPRDRVVDVWRAGWRTMCAVFLYASDGTRRTTCFGGDTAITQYSSRWPAWQPWRYPLTDLGAPFANDVLAVTGYKHHACVLNSGGDVMCWGGNSFGRLGRGVGSSTGNFAPSGTPTIVGTIVSISAGEYASCVTTSAGALLCAGRPGDLATENAYFAFTTMDLANDGNLVARPSLQECLPCDACYSGSNFEVSNCNATQQTVCQACTVCPAGEYETGACVVGADTGCSPCTLGVDFCPGGPDKFPCNTTGCPAGQYESAACAIEADRVCSACPVGSYCPGGVPGAQVVCPGAFQTTAGAGSTAASDCICQPGYRFEDFTPGNDCVECMHCPAGTFFANECTSTAPHVCDACGTEEYCPGDNMRYSCEPTVCPPGQFETAPCNATHDRECTACPAEHYCAGGRVLPVPCALGTTTHGHTGRWDAGQCFYCRAHEYCGELVNGSLVCAPMPHLGQPLSILGASDTLVLGRGEVYMFALWAGGGGGSASTDSGWIPKRGCGGGFVAGVFVSAPEAALLDLEGGAGGRRGSQSDWNVRTFRDGGWPPRCGSKQSSGYGGGSSRVSVDGVEVAVAGAGGGGGTHRVSSGINNIFDPESGTGGGGGADAPCRGCASNTGLAGASATRNGQNSGSCDRGAGGGGYRGGLVGGRWVDTRLGNGPYIGGGGGGGSHFVHEEPGNATAHLRVPIFWMENGMAGGFENGAPGGRAHVDFVAGTGQGGAGGAASGGGTGRAVLKRVAPHDAHAVIPNACFCVRGTVRDGGACSVCPSAHYCPLLETTSPVLCPSDSWNVAEGRVGAVECMCLAGFFLAGNSFNFTATCPECPSMEYCIGDNSHHRCPVRMEPTAMRDACECVATFAASENMSSAGPYPASCDCVPGRHMVNDSYCAPCPVDYYCPSTDTMTPLPCPAYSSTEGVEGAVTLAHDCHCDPHFVFDAEREVCQCPPGRYIVNGSVCMPCPVDAFCADNDTITPTACPIDFHVPNGGARVSNECRPCVPPHNATGSADETVCRCPEPGQEASWEEFVFSGANATYVVPRGAVGVRIYAWGAGGGSGKSTQHSFYNAYGGGGGFVAATLFGGVRAGDTLVVQVGEGGRTNAAADANATINPVPWPDGSAVPQCTTDSRGAGGGGSSRVAFDGQWIVVAGGGGGGAGRDSGTNRGGGGGRDAYVRPFREGVAGIAGAMPSRHGEGSTTTCAVGGGGGGFRGGTRGAAGGGGGSNYAFHASGLQDVQIENGESVTLVAGSYLPPGGRDVKYVAGQVMGRGGVVFPDPANGQNGFVVISPVFGCACPFQSVRPLGPLVLQDEWSGCVSDCIPGTYQIASVPVAAYDDFMCTDCPINTYCPAYGNPAPVPCPAFTGTRLLVSALSVDWCQCLYADPTTGECGPCPEGYYCIGNGTARVCPPPFLLNADQTGCDCPLPFISGQLGQIVPEYATDAVAPAVFEHTGAVQTFTQPAGEYNAVFFMMWGGGGAGGGANQITSELPPQRRRRVCHGCSERGVPRARADCDSRWRWQGRAQPSQRSRVSGRGRVPWGV